MANFLGKIQTAINVFKNDVPNNVELTGLKNPVDSLIIVLVHWREQNRNMTVPRSFWRRMKQGFLKNCRNKKSLDFSRLSIGAESGT